MTIEQPTGPGMGRLHDLNNETVSGLPEFQKPVNIQDALERIRQSGEFQPAEKGWLEQLLEQPWAREASEDLHQALGQFFDGFSRFLNQVTGSRFDQLPDLLANMLMGLLAFGAGLIGLYILYGLLGWAIRWFQLQESRVTALPSEWGAGLSPTASYHHKQAAELAGQGKYDLALRQLYLGLLLGWDERSLLVFDRARSNQEYLQHLHAKMKEPVLEKFQALISVFDRVRYGHQPLSEADYLACRQAVDALEKEAAS